MTTTGKPAPQKTMPPLHAMFYCADHTYQALDADRVSLVQFCKTLHWVHVLLAALATPQQQHDHTHPDTLTADTQHAVEALAALETSLAQTHKNTRTLMDALRKLQDTIKETQRPHMEGQTPRRKNR